MGGKKCLIWVGCLKSSFGSLGTTAEGKGDDCEEEYTSGRDDARGTGGVIDFDTLLDEENFEGANVCCMNDRGGNAPAS